MTIESSNLTHKEYFHLNGALSVERQEEILESLVDHESMNVQEYAPYAQEASGQYPAEDFLAEHVSDLWALSKRLRGDNKQELTKIIQSIEDALQCQVYATEYGRSELHKIISTIKRS